MKREYIILFFISIVLILGACSKEKQNPFEAAADVYYLSKVRGDSIVVGLVYYAFGNQPMTSGEVSTPDGKKVQLNKSIENGYTIFYEPYEDDFDTIYPPEGTYVFDLKSANGDKLQIDDALKKSGLVIPHINSIVYEALDESYDISWNFDINADAYKMYLYDETREIVFVSNFIDNGSGIFTLIENDMGTWEKQVNYGDKYIIQLQALNYVENVISGDLDNQTAQKFNLQEIAVAEKSFYWNRE